MSIIRPTKAAGMINAATSIWPSKGTRSCGFPGYEVLRNAAAVRRQIEQAIDERIEQRPPSSPSPSCPATKASTTRPRRGGEGKPRMKAGLPHR